MMAVEKFEYWREGPAGHMRNNILSARMEHVFRRREVQLMNELRQFAETSGLGSLRPGSLGRVVSLGGKEEKKMRLALKLCRRRGALTEDVDEENSLGEPPIVAAGVHGDVMHLGLLCLAGCDVNAQARDGSTALHRACMMGNERFAEGLIEKHAQLHATDGSGMTCLHVALDLGQSPMVRFLLEQELEIAGREGGGVGRRGERLRPPQSLCGGGRWR